MKKIALKFKNKQAIQEGWDLYVNEGSICGPVQLQCNDGDTAFKDDLDAIRYVVGRAIAGSKYHKEAISILVSMNPLERVTITKAITA